MDFYLNSKNGHYVLSCPEKRPLKIYKNTKRSKVYWFDRFLICLACYLMKAVTEQKSSLHSVATQSWLSLLSLSWTSGIMTTSATRLGSPELPLWDWLRELLAMLFILLTELRVVCLVGSKGSTTICSVPLISARQKGQPPPFPSESCKNRFRISKGFFT